MNIINIDGIVGSWDVDSNQIIQQLNNISGDVTIKLNSVGGSVIEGISIFNAIKAYSKGTVTVEISAVAASIASYIALAADKVVVNSNSIFMIHNAWMPAVGDFRELRKAADISEALSSIISKAYIAKTNKTSEFIQNMMNDETYFYGEEITLNGFADEIIPLEGETTKAQAMAVAVESLKACNNAVYENTKEIDFEAVAKILPKEEKKEEIKVVDLSAQQMRARKLYILEKGL